MARHNLGIAGSGRSRKGETTGQPIQHKSTGRGRPEPGCIGDQEAIFGHGTDFIVIGMQVERGKVRIGDPLENSET
jgi:hypothetical protein